MAKFTTEEANSSIIVRAESQLKDGVHQYWVFGVNDGDGNYYDWKDPSLNGSATDSEQKIAIFNCLTTICEKKVIKPVVSTESNEDIINTTVGS